MNEEEQEMFELNIKINMGIRKVWSGEILWKSNKEVEFELVNYTFNDIFRAI